MMISMPSYPIVEIFHSVQGEGYHTGIPHVFVRFGNCNLRCEWCDTNFLEYEMRDLEDIVSEVSSYNCDRVIFTGGEPALQDLGSIGMELKKLGFHISIETNGTIPVDPIVDWICVSPKDQLYPDAVIRQRSGNELKVVYCGQDLSMYDELRTGFEHHFLQPCYMEAESVESNGSSFRMVESLVKRTPGWRLSLQTHKWMGVL
ncbi:MAG: radical SAM protein [Euryarchaeota archaeon]|nr:radical SAM protein [Euryarchaeota archaeon]NDB93977.1 radical SAM protein [Euryarchaeota archaeon]NDF22257.1 radical SAM protein [Euryarchaeota archaeon]NDF36962.1 radical SAM protein [Euryarchaeota archaeon]NDG21814.1 radical SAM protein [Euryarchaeota archaeon]